MDFGVKTFLTLNDGNKIENPKVLKKLKIQSATKNIQKLTKKKKIWMKKPKEEL